MAVGRTRQHSGADIWPGFVDALAALLIIVIFLLMVFTLAQYFLSDILTGRDRALDRLNRQVAQLTEMLSLEQAENTELEASVSRLTLQLGELTSERDRLSGQLAELLPERDMLTNEVAALTRERDALKATSARTAAELEDAYKTIGADKEKIELQLRRLASLERDIAALREVRDTLEKKVAGLEDSLQSRDRELGALRDRSKELATQLASSQERTRLAQIEIDDRDVRLRDLGARASRVEEELTAEQAVSAEAREQVRILNLQIAALRQQLARIEAALDVSEKKAKEQNVQIVNLSKRLNAALASKVQELASFRSEFFGRLRKALGDRSDVRIVGDRFVFQSEVLFPSGEARLQPGGRVQIDKLARTIREIAGKIPDDIDWVLRVDGHTDRLPIKTPAFPSNWELSTGRAIAVVKHLIERGVPATRLAATGFGEFQPIDRGSTIAAFRRNRRIEFKLTQR